MRRATRRFAGVILFLGVCCFVLLGGARAPHAQSAARSAAQRAPDVPRFTYDGTWPKLPLPNGNVPATGAPPCPPDIDVLAGGVEGAEFDDQAREVFLVDNYLSGRVMVFDMDPPFKFKRGWGAYGKPLKEIAPGPRPAYDPAAPPDTYKDFLGHVTLAIAGREAYIADRSGDRVQVFTKDGKFVREFLVAPQTRGRGSAGGLAPSKDSQQLFLYVSDIMNNVVWIVNRQEGKTIGRIGFQGHSGGGFRWLHMVATDSKGNVYTGEVDSGKRVQKFVPASGLTP